MISVDLVNTLQQTWQALCADYDVTADLPEWEVLFRGVDLSGPTLAAQTVVANMLAEIIECVGRFSPWYRQTAESFGLTLTHDRGAQQVYWTLTPEAKVRRRRALEALNHAIGRNLGVLLATRVVSDMSEPVAADDPCVLASCRCVPPRSILVNRSVITGAEIVCDTCHQRFR